VVNEMKDDSTYDRIRAWVRGTAPEHEARAFERVLASQRDLARAAEEFREVHEMTRPLRDEVPASRLQFADLEARIAADESARRPRLVRRAAAWIGIAFAAAAAITLAIALANRPRAAQAEELRLTAIALDGAGTRDRGAAGAVSDDLPATLASYEPVRDGQVSWITDVGQARAIARAVDRPVLLFGMFETCPLCRQMKAEGLRDPSVLALFSDYVPLQVDLLQVDDAQRAEYFSRGYPLFEVHSAEGELVHAFPGFHDASELAENLARGLANSQRTQAPLAWNEVHRAAQGLETAREDEADGRLGAAHREFSAVEHQTEHGALTDSAQRGIERIASAARDALLHARDIAASSAPDAERALADAARRFEGSPFAGDLDAALASLQRTGRFPQLAPAAESSK
jgi:hypothetical protein